MAIRTIVRSRYLNVPRTVVARLVSVSALLHKHAPDPRSVDVEAALAVLDAKRREVRAACVARHREHGPSIAAEESELDACVDRLLHIFRDRLEHWAVFSRAGVQRLAAAQEPDGFDYAARIAKADRAAAIGRLLLARGLDFTRTPYAEQAEAMQILATIVAEEGVLPELEALVGPDFVGALADARIAYGAMVEARALRAEGSAVNLNELRLELAHTIEGYLIAVLAMLREDDPDNVARIHAALRPFDALCLQLERERSRAGSAAPDPSGESPDSAAPADADIDELLAEQRAFEAELGLASPPGG